MLSRVNEVNKWALNDVLLNIDLDHLLHLKGMKCVELPLLSNGIVAGRRFGKVRRGVVRGLKAGGRDAGEADCFCYAE
jgi:hypothetical protein